MNQRTKQFHAALRKWDAASKAHNKDVHNRGGAYLDTKRLKLLLARKEALIELNAQFHKLIGQ